MNQPYGPTYEVAPKSAQELGSIECRPPQSLNLGQSGIPSTDDTRMLPPPAKLDNHWYPNCIIQVRIYKVPTGLCAIVQLIFVSRICFGIVHKTNFLRNPSSGMLKATKYSN